MKAMRGKQGDEGNAGKARRWARTGKGEAISACTRGFGVLCAMSQTVTWDALSWRNARRAGTRGGDICVTTRSVMPAAPPLSASSDLSVVSQSACDNNELPSAGMNPPPAHWADAYWQGMM